MCCPMITGMAHHHCPWGQKIEQATWVGAHTLLPWKVIQGTHKLLLEKGPFRPTHQVAPISESLVHHLEFGPHQKEHEKQFARKDTVIQEGMWPPSWHPCLLCKVDRALVEGEGEYWRAVMSKDKGTSSLTSHCYGNTWANVQSLVCKGIHSCLIRNRNKLETTLVIFSKEPLHKSRPTHRERVICRCLKNKTKQKNKM